MFEAHVDRHAKRESVAQTLNGDFAQQMLRTLERYKDTVSNEEGATCCCKGHVRSDVFVVCAARSCHTGFLVGVASKPL